MRRSADEHGEDRLLCVQAVFGLGEDGVCVGLEGGFCDFQSAVGGEAVEDERAGFCELQGVVVDLVARELGFAVFGFLFLAHAHPHVGVEDVGAFACGVEVFGDDEFSAAFVFVGALAAVAGWEGAFHGGGVGLVLVGRGDAELKVELAGGPHPRDGHVAGAVADEGDDLSGESAAHFHDRLEIGENLARVLGIGERVDGGDAAVFGKVFDVRLCESADDGTVAHAAEDACGVGNRFAAAELDIVGGEKEDVAPEFADADLEGNAGARRGLGKHERPALVAERVFIEAAAIGLHRLCEVEDGEDFLTRQRFDREQVFHIRFWLLKKEAEDESPAPACKPHF